MLACLRNWRSHPLPTDIASHMASHNSSIEESEPTCGYGCAWHARRLRALVFFYETTVTLTNCSIDSSYRLSELNLAMGGPIRIPNPKIKGELCRFTNSTASTFFPNTKYDISSLHSAESKWLAQNPRWSLSPADGIPRTRTKVLHPVSRKLATLPLS